MSAQADRHPLHWLPNALTVSRILLIPVLVWALLTPFVIGRMGLGVSFNASALALGLFLFCMVTDFLDGYFARKWKITSDFGRMLDPIADKLLVAACLIAICIVNIGTALIVVPSLIIIGRDIFVSGIREHAANSNIILSPTKLAKWKTACEMLAILLFILALVVPYTPNLPEDVLTAYAAQGLFAPINVPVFNGFLAVLWLAAALSAYTGFHYFRSAMRRSI